MKKRKLDQMVKTSYGKNLWANKSTTELLRSRSKPKNELQIEELVINDMKKKIIQDEMNQIHFYQIQPLDLARNNQSYRSKHNFSDLSLIRGTKFHQKIIRTPLEKSLRKKIAQEEPGSLLFIREIYEKFEENKEVTVKIDYAKKEQEIIKHQQNSFQPDSDIQQIQNLEHWQREMKRKKEEQQQHEQEIKEKEDLKYKYFKRGSTAGTPNTRKSTINKQFQFPLLVKQVQEAQKQLQQANQTSQNQSPKKVISLKDKLKQSVEKIKIQQKQNLSQQESSINKSIEKYLNQGENLTADDFKKVDSKQQNTNGLVFEYTSEGLKNTLHQLIKMQITSFNSAYDRANFYEKQTNEIFTKVDLKIQEYERIVRDKKKTLDLLRVENHEIYEKTRQIKNLILDLQEELKSVSNSKDLKQIQKNQARNNQIDNYMAISQKKIDIENNINMLKKSQDSFQQKLNFNINLIEKLEKEIIQIQKNNKNLKKALEDFLYELLKIGLDSRNSGLIWIIKKIKEEGEIVNEAHLPNFLDSKAKEFLLKVKLILNKQLQKFKKNQDLENLIQKCHDHFNNYKNSIQDKDRSLSILSIDIGNNQSITQITQFTNSFAAINPNSVKILSAIKKKNSNQQDYNLLMQGVTPQEKKYIDKIVLQINTSKETQNDIVYREAKNKLQTIFAKMQEQLFQQKESNINESQNESLQQYKEKMITQYVQVQKKIAKKEQTLQVFEEEELHRLIKEIDFKNYLNRQQIQKNLIQIQRGSYLSVSMFIWILES